MSEAKSIEDMKAELEATGKYRFYQVGNEYFVNLPEVWHVYGRGKLPSLIQKAYAHHQREKRYEELQRSYAELEAGIEKLQARLAKVERELESLRGDGK